MKMFSPLSNNFNDEQLLFALNAGLLTESRSKLWCEKDSVQDTYLEQEDSWLVL